MNCSGIFDKLIRCFCLLCGKCLSPTFIATSPKIMVIRSNPKLAMLIAYYTHFSFGICVNCFRVIIPIPMYCSCLGDELFSGKFFRHHTSIIIWLITISVTNSDSNTLALNTR